MLILSSWRREAKIHKEKNLSIAEMSSAYTRLMEDARKKANKLLLEEQQENFLGTIEVNPRGSEMENHEDITLRSGGEIEELNEVEEVEEGDEELVEKVTNEEESTSPELEEKNEEVEKNSRDDFLGICARGVSK